MQSAVTVGIVPGEGGEYSMYPWVGRCGPAPHTLTLFKAKIADFPTLFKTFNPKPYPVPDNNKYRNSFSFKPRPITKLFTAV